MIEQAKREAISLIIGISGASGSGKTMSMMRIARGIAGTQPFVVIDTETRRSRIYADHFQPWNVLDLEPPFTPARYLDAIREAVGTAAPVVCVDSFSHEHEGEGGLLDMQEAEVDRMAGANADYKRREALAMAGWIKPKREHKRLVREFTRLGTHVIIGLRAEEKIEMRRNADGKLEVVPVVVATGAGGWVPICEKRLPYELTLSLLVTPSAPGIPKPIKLPEDLKPMVPLDRVLDEEVGARLAKWAAGDGTSEPVDPARAEELTAELVELAHLHGRLDEVQAATIRARESKSPRDFVVWLQIQIARFKAAPTDA
jgi:hypothetical protein